jgi:SpoVK/Ycf46/Vps4 family AAA+-type ATPase
VKSSAIPYLSPAQAEALKELRPILKLATSTVRPALNLPTRVHTLITGPSGSGKSFLARALAKEAGLQIWEANVSTWIVLGARSANPTLVSLVEWIHKTPQGVIFLDELEKPFPANFGGSSGGFSDWFNSVKMELHELLDGRVPEAAIQVDDSILNHTYGGELSSRECRSLVKHDVERKLKTSYMVIGAGTWQHLWAETESTIGFNRATDPVLSIDHHRLMKSISPEILLRFRQQVLFLRPMAESDFHEVLTAQLGMIAEPQRRRYAELVLRAIPRAIEFGLGMRIFEEVYTDFCVEVLQNSHPNERSLREALVGKMPDLI